MPAESPLMETIIGTVVGIGVSLVTWFFLSWVPQRKASARFCGQWELYDIDGPNLKKNDGPMTTFRHGPWWEPRLLMYEGMDPPIPRKLRGSFVLDDPADNRATGVIHYVDEPGAEFDKRELYAPNENKIFVVTGNPTAYPNHVLIRVGHTPQTAL